MNALSHLKQLPVTSVLLGIPVLLSILRSYDVIFPYDVMFTPTLVYENKQYWRIITSLFYVGEINLRSAFFLVWIFWMSSSMEQHYFIRRPLDYVLVVTIGCAAILTVRMLHIVTIPFLYSMLEMMLVYLSSRVTPDVQVDIFLFITMPMRFLPYLQLVLNFFGNKSSLHTLIVSYLIGHVIWYILEVFPRITGLHLLRIHDKLHHIFRDNHANIIDAL